MPILVTGFEPFSGSTLNPSQLIVAALAETQLAENLVLEVLPVEYDLDDANLADNSGETRTGQPISSHGSSDLATTLPVDALLEQLSSAGIPAESSTSAGTFVCNHIFYVMQQLLAGTEVRSGFIHVPLVPEQASEFSGKPTMSLATQVEAFTIVLSYLERA